MTSRLKPNRSFPQFEESLLGSAILGVHNMERGRRGWGGGQYFLGIVDERLLTRKKNAGQTNAGTIQRQENFEREAFRIRPPRLPRRARGTCASSK